MVIKNGTFLLANGTFALNCCCTPCGCPATSVLSGGSFVLPPGYAQGFTDPATAFRTITFTGCDGYVGEQTQSWTFDDVLCGWVLTTDTPIPDRFHNTPCSPISNTEWVCTGEQDTPCEFSTDRIVLSDPVVCD